jgi:hypothetical protein
VASCLGIGKGESLRRFWASGLLPFSKYLFDKATGKFYEFNIIEYYMYKLRGRQVILRDAPKQILLHHNSSLAWWPGHRRSAQRRLF